jgi:hypothetical protein
MDRATFGALVGSLFLFFGLVALVRRRDWDRDVDWRAPGMKGWDKQRRWGL